jgi:cytosolic carboxypeptidase protein 2/3
MYGNTDEEEPEKYRIFPFILSKICHFFSYRSSKFSVQKSKSSTARITMWKELNIPNVFTIEASFLGPSIVIFSSLVLWSLD